MRYLAYLVLSLSLASCSYLLPSTTPNLGGLLADRGDTRPFEQSLPINTQPKRLALGSSFAIGVKEDGTVWSWGSQSCGRLGTGAMWEGTTNTPTQITGIADFVEVAAGSNHILALRKDGTVWSWGENKQGQLGYKEDGYAEAATSQYKAVYYSCQLTPKQIPDLKEVVSIAAGSDVSYALDKQGNVYRWGLKELSRDRKHDVLTPTPQQIYHHADAVRIRLLIGQCAILTRHGNLKLLSDSENFSIKPYATNETPLGVNNAPFVFDLKMTLPIVDAGVYISTYFFLLNDGSVWAIGNNRDGALGQGDLSPHQGLVKVKNIGRITQIADNGVAAVDEKNHLWLWGSNVHWRPALDSANDNKEPYPIRVSINAPIKFITTNRAIAIGLEDGHVLFMQEDNGIRGTGKPPRSPQTTELLMTPEQSLWTWK